jgi:uncharacterized protein (DUF2141 family)
MRKAIFTLVYACAVALSACEYNEPKKEEGLKQTPEETLAITESASELKKPEKTETAITTPAENEPIVETEAAPKTVPLTVVVDNLKSPDAPVELSIYGPDNKFPDKDDHLKNYRFKPKNGKLVAKIKDLPYGELAVALYQDVDSNGEINKNGIGIPTEPYAFSNNFRPIIKAPTFEDCKFNYTQKENTISIALK